MKFSEEYANLELRVTEAFSKKREEIVEIDFLNNNTNFEDFDDYFNALEECPTSFYNNKNGEEIHVYVTKIDSEGIHVVESEDTTKTHCIGFSELNGLYYQIDLLENIERNLNFNRDILEFLSKYGVKVEQNEPDHYVELMMDNHKCIKFEGIEYYVPEDSMLFSDIEIEILEHLIEKFVN